jgi:hypothetical protein
LPVASSQLPVATGSLSVPRTGNWQLS